MIHDIEPRDAPERRPYRRFSDLTLLVLYETLGATGDIAEAARVNQEWRLRQAERNRLDEASDVMPSTSDLVTPSWEGAIINFSKKRPAPDGEDG